MSRDLTEKVQVLAQELGKLKGSALKLGQLLSTYGEHLLPPEANAYLKKLQFQSPPLPWSQMQDVLKLELSGDVLQDLTLDPNPLASASLGQVHRATRKSDGAQLAVKIQYPLVEQTIDGDLKLLKALLTLSRLVPSGPRFDQIFDEIKHMLHQEVDYRNELKWTQLFHKELLNQSYFIVPQVFPELSARKVITTEYLAGSQIDSTDVQALSQKQRDQLGSHFFDLYLQELLSIGVVQTDPHFGNYRIRLCPDSGEPQLILFDFGACRSVPTDFLNHYRKLIRGGFERNKDLITEGSLGLGLLQADDPQHLSDLYIQLCFLITEPFEKSTYSWGESDLPRRVTAIGMEIIKQFKFRAPPRELIFLDRKLGGVFVFLAKLGCQSSFRDQLAFRIAPVKVKGRE